MKKIIFAIILMLFVQQNIFSQKIDSLLNIYENSDIDSVKAAAIFQIHNKFKSEKSDSCYYYENLLVDFLLSKNDLTYNQLRYYANFFSYLNSYKNAIKVFKKSIDLAKNIEDYDFVLQNNIWIGYYYIFTSEFEKSFKILFENIKLSEEKNIKKYLARNYLILGYAYRDYDDYENAKLFFEKSKNCNENEDFFNDKTAALNEIGNIESYYGNYEKSLEYQLEALKIREEEKDSIMLKYSYNDVSTSYLALHDFEKAIFYFGKSLELGKKEKDSWWLGISYLNLGETYNQKGEFQKAKLYLDSSNIYTEKLNLLDLKNLLSQAYSEYYDSIGDISKAYFHYKEAIKYQDSIKSEELEEQIKELSVKYETELKDKELIAANEKIKRKNFVILTVLIGLFIVTILLILLYKLFNKLKLKNAEILQKNEEILTQKEEIETQKNFILEQNKALEIKNKHITDSIIYAQRIQNAVLPTNEIISDIFNNYFIYYKPRDIVSGDFYWVKQIKNIKLIAVADCTGHGVPGAFMSMLGIAILNELVRNENITSPELVLEGLRKYLKNSLNQSEKNDSSKDGMDISFCTIDENQNFEFSGANNSGIIVRNKEIIFLQADKQPIGIYINEKEFSKISMKIKKNDMIYLFSDGYRDQFGGKDGKKFQFNQFKELLIDISNENCNIQQQKLDYKLNEWINYDGKNYSQIDDILVFGIRM